MYADDHRGHGETAQRSAERWFAIITSQAIRRGSFDSVRALEHAIMRYLANWNEYAQPFRWTRSTTTSWPSSSSSRADPNYAPMYAQRSRRVKTDKRDARALAEACRLRAYRPAHRTSEEQRHVRALLGVRDKLVRTRAGVITLVQAVLSREGIRVPTGSSVCFSARLEKLELTEHLGSEISPLLALLGPLNEQIARLDERLGELAVKDERVKRLLTMPQIGPVTAVSFVATLDEVGRFRGAHQVEAYLGLVPREWSSSEVQRRGRITKAGNSRMRWLLVEAAWRVATHQKRPETLALREWADRIARRRGMRVAVVALARKLGGILYAMWRDGSAYDPAKLGGTQGTSATLAA